MLRFFFKAFSPLKWSSCAVSPSALCFFQSVGWAGYEFPFFAPLCQHHSLQYRQEVSFFPKANETSWTISSFFPRSKDWHKGEGVGNGAVNFSAPTIEESADSASKGPWDPAGLQREDMMRAHSSHSYLSSR